MHGLNAPLDFLRREIPMRPIETGSRCTDGRLKRAVGDFLLVVVLHPPELSANALFMGARVE
ncbi:basic helix-loop-helix domain-containing protein [Neoroseomonas oryzicola]|uniref:Uncharacterized protein n=1 Tax=Neoroseomonas oryzicola TaxID=535904 RepID=A0A9X9WE88_9PROT|nr:hypothetical protein [Neoroseomonas oryzicola]MBR0658648.1 hypothetical protein [Neoroseomonas oryzicola]NKE17916.1 hypothetical protein [Neoroseomonas oryzicola]